MRSPTGPSRSSGRSSANLGVQLRHGLLVRRGAWRAHQPDRAGGGAGAARRRPALAGQAAAVAAGLVVGGALGNLLDRVSAPAPGLLGGAVVDFIDVQWWPIFNVADIAICVGAGLLAILSFRNP